MIASRPRVFAKNLTSAMVVVAVALLVFPARGAEPYKMRHNFFGSHNLKDGGPSIEVGFDWTLNMNGSNSYVFDWVTDPWPWVEAAFERDLIPCIRVQECNGGCTPSAAYAGNMAWSIINYKIAHPQYMDRLVYLQLWNEPSDPRDKVDPDVFADYLVDAHSAVHTAENQAAQTYSDLAGTFRTMTPGQNGWTWWEEAFNHNPDAKFAFDVWGTHPYPESYPPWYNHHDGVSFGNKSKTIDSYLFDLDVVAKPHGSPSKSRRGFPVMITETAYGDHLGISYEGYPKTSRQMAADYNVSAFGTFWYQWPEIIAVQPFILANISWDHFAFVHWYSDSEDTDSDGVLEPTDPYPQYTAVRNLQIALEDDDLLIPAPLTPYRGDVGNIQGTITSGGEPLPYATIFTDGYEYGNVSLYDGVYRAENVPTGSYTLGCQKYGYTSQTRSITVVKDQTITENFSLSLVGKLHKGIYFEDCIPGSYCSGNCTGCNSGGNSFVGQTFKTPDDVEFLKFVALKCDVGYPTEIKFSILDGGPTGNLVSGSVAYRLIEYADAGTMCGVEYPDGQEPEVSSNHTYFMKVERSAGGGIFGFMTDQNPYPDGMAYTDTTGHSNWDLKACIRGMTGYAGPTSTPKPTNTPAPTNTPGGPTNTPTATVAANPSPPAVSNPSFESGLGSEWTLWYGSGSNTDAPERDYLGGNAYDGVWVLGIKGFGAGGKGVFQHVNNNWVDGRQYEISVWVKNVSNTNINYAVGYQLGSTGASGGTTATYGETVEHPSSWTEATVELVYSGSSGVTVYLRAVNDGHGERAGFDLVEIADIGGGGPVPTSTPTNTAIPTNTYTPTNTPYGGGPLITENFESMPQWDSQYDAGWGSAASWNTAVGGQSGNYLRAIRSSGGSSSKVNVYTVPSSTTLDISIYMRCPSMSGTYWMEAAYRLGSYTAQNFDQSSGSWTMIEKFESSNNGNGDNWTEYSKSVGTSSYTQISIGYKLGATGSTSYVGWDTLAISD